MNETFFLNTNVNSVLHLQHKSDFCLDCYDILNSNEPNPRRKYCINYIFQEDDIRKQKILDKLIGSIVFEERWYPNFYFRHGKYEGKYIDEIADVKYLKWFLKKIQLSMINRTIFELRIHLLQCKIPLCKCCCGCVGCLNRVL